MITQLSFKQVKIRKVHRCFSCRRAFEVGSEMMYGRYVNEGDLYGLYTCLTCDKIHDKCKGDFDNEEGIPLGFVQEQLREGTTPEELLASYESDAAKASYFLK